MAGADVIDNGLPVRARGAPVSNQPIPQLWILFVEQFVKRMLQRGIRCVKTLFQPAADQRIQLARAAAPRASTYVYNFGFLNARARARNETGVPHGGEMVFVWGFGPLAAFAPPQDTGMSATMQRYWTNFAKTGNANGDGLPTWPKFEGAHPQTLVIDDTPHPVADFHKPQFDLARTVKGDE